MEQEEKFDVLEEFEAIDTPQKLNTATKAVDNLLKETMAKKGFRIANSEAAFFEGAYNAFTLANDLTGDTEADQAIRDALLRQTVAQGISSVLGYGIGMRIDYNQKRQMESVKKAFTESMGIPPQ